MSAPEDVCVKCPVCETECSAAPIYCYTAEQAAAHFCSATRNRDRNDRLRQCIERLWDGNDCQILRCGNCGFGFGHPFVGGDEEFYGLLHEQKGYPKWRWDYDVATERALAHATPGRLLDVGAGTGAFLRGLDDAWECYAVEGSEDTRQDLERAGITVFRDLSRAAEEAKGTFSVVTFFQSMEHIADFAAVLRSARVLLERNGRIVITVPDGDAMIRQETLTGCPDMPPNHICKWTPKSLGLALEKAGFRPGAAIEEPAGWSHFANAMYLNLASHAARENSISAQIYRIKSRSVRVPLLAVAGTLLSYRLLGHVRELRKGGAFAMVGTAC